MMMHTVDLLCCWVICAICAC